MDKKVVQEYLQEIPLEVRLALKPLSNENSLAILIVLLKEGDLRFTDIKNIFHSESSGEIDRLLKTLLISGLVKKNIKQFSEIADTARSEYSATDLSGSIIEALYRSVMPTFPRVLGVYPQVVPPSGEAEYREGERRIGYTNPSEIRMDTPTQPIIYGRGR